MEFKEKLDHCMYDLPSYEIEEESKFWRSMMENFILMGIFQNWVALKEEFKILIDDQGFPLQQDQSKEIRSKNQR